MVAAYNGHEAIVRLLLEKGADTESESDVRTTLLCAVQVKHAAIVRLLQEHGADIKASDSCGNTALSLARANCDEATIKILESCSCPSAE